MKRSIAGIILIVLSLAGMLYWELVGRDSLMYTQVLTLSRDVEQGTLITRDMLVLKKTDSPSPRSMRLADAGRAAGKEAVSFIPAGVELFDEYFEDEKLVVHEEEGEYIFSLPTGWLISYPQTLRRGDRVTFLLVKADDEYRDPEAQRPKTEGPETGDEILTTTVLYVKSSSNDEVVSDQDRLKGAQQVSVIEIIASKDDAKTLTRLAASGDRFVLLYQ
ncbi:MAG: SAF domain-containing protein [Firmicutes bacterium]|nr:SAF domain-containing protein [Bacillota bacterium]